MSVSFDELQFLPVLGLSELKNDNTLTAIIHFLTKAENQLNSTGNSMDWCFKTVNSLPNLSQENTCCDFEMDLLGLSDVTVSGVH